jgi:glutathione peroxidase
VNQYAIDFPMFAKTELKANPLFAELAKATGQAPRWNFHKYLVDRGGNPVAAFPSAVAPEDPRLVSALERILD